MRLQTLKNEGIVGMYRGMATPLCFVALFNAVLFSSRGAVNMALKHPDGAALTCETVRLSHTMQGLQYQPSGALCGSGRHTSLRESAWHHIDVYAANARPACILEPQCNVTMNNLRRQGADTTHMARASDAVQGQTSL